MVRCLSDLQHILPASAVPEILIITSKLRYHICESESRPKLGKSLLWEVQCMHMHMLSVPRDTVVGFGNCTWCS